jgi:hypothetical protein
MSVARPPEQSSRPVRGPLRHLALVPYLAVINGLTVLILGAATAPFVLPVVNVSLIGAYIFDEIKSARSKHT